MPTATPTSTTENSKITTKLTIPKVTNEKFNSIKPNLISAFAQSLNVEDTAVTMKLIVEAEDRSTSFRQVTEGSVVETSVAGLDETDAEKLKDEIVLRGNND